MKIFGAVIGSILAIVLLIVLAFGMEMGSLKWAGFFRPKWQDVERQTFERTQSFTHGKTQDLAKRFREYQEGDEVERAAIRSLMQTEFATFDADAILNDKLKQFLIEQRGY